MEFLKNHKQREEKYSGHTSDLSGYLQFGEIRTSNHELVAFTADRIKRCIDIIKSENYAYSRQKDGYINVYAKSDKSPTGVLLIGGIPNELEFLLYAFGRKGQLSPTEDLRTAH